MTRVLFGAHFPLDVGVGVVLGYEVGCFSPRSPTPSGCFLPPRAALPAVARLRCRLRPVDCETGLEGQRETG